MMEDLPWPALRRPLAHGGIAVVWVEAPADIEAARQLTRQVCAELVAGMSIEGLCVSRSATAGLGAVALCVGGTVGVDVERRRLNWVDDDLLRLALHPAERSALRRGAGEDFFGVWVRKEAVLKALGLGLALAPNTLDVGQASSDWTACSVPSIDSVQLRSLAAPPGFDAAIAIAGGASDELEAWRLRTAGGSGRTANLAGSKAPAPGWHWSEPLHAREGFQDLNALSARCQDPLHRRGCVLEAWCK